MKTMEKPRQVPSREDYYMGMAFWVASKSKDPNTQVGAYIVSEDNVPLSIGYNGPPSTVQDANIDWKRPNKYNFIHHAEDNAIWHGRNTSMQDATLYVTARPCKSCMLDIVRAGIRNVVFFNSVKIAKDSNSITINETEWEITKEIARLGAVSLVEFNGNLNWMRDRMKWMEAIGVFD